MTRRLVVIAATVLVISSCGGQHTVEADGVTIHVQRSNFLVGSGTDAEVFGSLALQDGCVVLEQEEAPDVSYPVVWPAGTAIASTEPIAIQLPSGDVADIGDTVTGAGGYLAADDVDVTLPDECFTRSPDGEIAVFNASDDPVTSS